MSKGAIEDDPTPPAYTEAGPSQPGGYQQAWGGYQPPPQGYQPQQPYQGGYPPTQGYPGYPPPQGQQGYPPPQGQQGYPPPQGYQGYPPPQEYPRPDYAQQAAAPSGNTSAVAPTASQENMENMEVRDDGDPESGGDEFTAFSEKSIRLGFIKKVFAILAVQMAITVAVLCAFLYWEDLAEFSQDNIWMYIAALVIFIVLIIVLSCLGDIRKKWPINLILLILVTLCMAWMLGSIASYYETDEVLMAVGIVLVVTIVCGILGLQTKIDFTWAVGIVVVLAVGLIGFGLLCAIVGSDFLYIMYASLGAMLFSFWLVIDIQLMMGGKGKVQVNPEEYIFAALNIYLDIVQILMYVLMIVGKVKG